MTETEATTVEARTDWRQLGIGIALVAALGWGIYRAIALRWISDDAFISFRYARNLIEGHGLVFNVGEYVEGYTNFLWTLLVSLHLWLGLDPVMISWIMGIASYAITAIILAFASVTFFGERDNRSILVAPVAALGFLLMPDSQAFATSGLETMFLTMLVTLGAVLLIRARSAGVTIAASVVLTLAALTRPDALLFVGMGFLYLLVAGPGTRKRALLYLLPFILIYAPYWWWRFDYYGHIFPNTYYAKSANLAWWSQGWEYVRLFFTSYYGLLLIIPAALLVKLPIISSFFKRWTISGPARRAGILAMMFVFPYLIYVLRVGGDFMFARFLIPVAPLMLLLIEAALYHVSRSDWLRLGIGVVVVLSLLFRYNQFETPTQLIHGIANEPAHYDAAKLVADNRLGTQLGAFWDSLAKAAGKEPVIAFYGTFAALVFYSDPAVAIEANAGLTDEYIAHLQISERGRPGHEKRAPFSYLVERGVHFLYVGTPPVHTELDKLRQIRFGRFESFIVTYDPAIMSTLRREYPQVAFTTYSEFLDEYVTVMRDFPDDVLARDYAYLSKLYFDHMPEVRARRFELPGSVGDYFRNLRERKVITDGETGEQ